MTQPGIPNEFVLSTACYGGRLKTIEDQAFASVAMGFRSLELGLSERPVPLNGWEDSHRETGIRVASVVVGALDPRSERMSGSQLGSSDAEERERALNCLRRHARLAQSLRAPVVVLRGCAVEDARLAAEARALEDEFEQAAPVDREELHEKACQLVGRVQRRGQKQLEHFCRALHTLSREYPETRVAIEPGWKLDDLLSLQAVEWALDDLRRQGVGYWHDAVRVHWRAGLGLPPHGAWLETFAPRMLGIHLADATEQEVGLPPGAGEIDFKLVAEYLPSEAARVLEVDSRHGRPEVLAAVQFLIAAGF